MAVQKLVMATYGLRPMTFGCLWLMARIDNLALRSAYLMAGPLDIPVPKGCASGLRET